MSKLFIQSLKALPNRFVDDETQFADYGDKIYVAHPKYAPMRFNGVEWEEIRNLNKVAR